MNYDSDKTVPPVWNVGDVILGAYEVKQVFRSGGVGLVYRVRHVGWNMDLAVKSPRPELIRVPRDLELFERECETWVNLGLHPHTVSCYYVRNLGGVARTFAEFVEGGSLLDWIQQGQLYVGGNDAVLRRILDIAVQMAWGLHYAHEQKLVHQDVKPGNILMTLNGTAKVSDFGFAKGTSAMRQDVAPSEEQSVLVSSGGFTPAYCSPEQAKSELVTKRTDIWSWAVSVLHMLFGEIAWKSGLAAPAALERHAEGKVQLKHLSQIPASLTGLLRICFQANPESRPASMEEIAVRLIEIYRHVTAQRYTRRDPRPADLLADGLNNRAISVLDLGGTDLERHTKAEKLLDQALQVDRHHAQATYNRGLLLWRSSRATDEAVLNALGEIRRAEPENRVVGYLIARIHLERGDGEAATATLEELEQRAPSDLDMVFPALTRAHVFQGSTRSWVRDYVTSTGEIQAACLSADGQWLLSKHADGTLRLTECSTSKCAHVFEKRDERLSSIFSGSDGRAAVLTLESKTLSMWDLESGHRIHEFEGHTKRVNCACVSSDGRLILSGSMNVTPRLWDAATGKCLRELEDSGAMGSVYAVSVSEDSRWGITAGAGGTIRVWELATGRCIRKFQGHTGWMNFVKCVWMSPDKRWVLSGGVDKTARLWDVATGECLRILQGHNAAVTTVCMSRDNRLILSGGEDKTLRFWDATSGRCFRTFGEEVGALFSVGAVSAKRWQVLSLADKRLRLWEFQAPCSIQPYEIVRPRSTSDLGLEATAVERSLATAKAVMEKNPAKAMRELMSARKVSGYEMHPILLQQCREVGLRGRRTGLRGAVVAQQFKGHTQDITSVCLSPDGRFAVSGSHDGMIGVWNIANGECSNVLRQHSRCVRSVCVSHDGHRVVSGSDDKTIRLWDVATGKCLRVFEGHTGCVMFAQISPNGGSICSQAWDGTIRVWDVASGGCLRTIEQNIDSGVDAVCLSSDCQSLFTGGLDNVLRIWNLEAGTCLREFDGAGSVNALAISPDGDGLLLGSKNGVLRLWSISTGTIQRSYEGHAKAVRTAFVASDGRWGLSGSEDATVRLWNLTTGECAHVFEGHAGAVTSACMSQDGRWILSGATDAVVRLWDLEWDYDFQALSELNVADSLIDS